MGESLDKKREMEALTPALPLTAHCEASGNFHPSLGLTFLICKNGDNHYSYFLRLM